MSTLINKIEQLIKREKTTPDRQKNDESKKTSSEILTELFGVFNATPPKISDTVKKSKKSKKKHKKEKKKRSRSSSDSEDSNYSYKNKKRKKSKSSKKSRHDSTSSGSRTPPKPNISDVMLRLGPEIKSEDIKLKTEVKSETKPRIKHERITFKTEKNSPSYDSLDASLIPMPDSPKSPIDKLDYDKVKGKIQIKNLKFSTVFEETVKLAEEEARKKAEMCEDGEYTDSSSSTVKEELPNSEFPKSSDPGGILKQQADDQSKLNEENKSKIRKRSKKSRERSKSRKRSRSRSTSRKGHSSKSERSSHYDSRSRHRSRSRNRSRSRHRSRSKHRSRSRHRSQSRHRSRSRSDKKSSQSSRRRSRSRRRSNSRSRLARTRHSPRHRGGRRSRSPTGVRLADSEKKRLLEVARRNAINMLKNGAVPAGAAALPPHTRNQVMAAIQSGGKSVDELTDFCKHLSKKEALGDLSSVSDGGEMSENEDTLAFHHPFLVKEKAPIVMNIRGGAPLPIKGPTTVANKDELRLQFPVSSGNDHRQSQWLPVEPPPPKDNETQSPKRNQKSPKLAITAPSAFPAICDNPNIPPEIVSELLPPPLPPFMKGFSSGNELLSSVPSLPLPPPGPQAYPSNMQSTFPKKDMLSQMVLEKLANIRREQERQEASQVGQVAKSTLGQFMGSTGAHILTPKELASGTQAWAKKDQLQRAAPVLGGMGMHLLQKMGWTPGQGLGKEGTGTLQPLLLEVKLDTRGLQAKEEMKSQRGMRRNNNNNHQAAPISAGGKHPVSLLGEYCSKHKLGPPEYNLCFECGPDHKKNFLFRVCVKVGGTEYQPAVASANKKQAKADAAQLALQKLGILT